MADGGIVIPSIRRLATTRRGHLFLGLLVREIFSGFWTGHPFDLEMWLRNG
jgi:hypothetical protein